MELVRQIYELTKSYPQSENYGLINQMRRAAISVSANISEGAARNTKSELDTHLEISLALGYVKERSLRELSLLMNDVDKMLSGLIKSLKR